MKLKTILATAAGLLASSSLFGLSSFSDDFEGDLSAWTGKSGGAHSGVIVADPLDGSNHVLAFSNSVGGGDIFTIDTVSTVGSYLLSFDYMAGAQSNGSGFLGLSLGLPGTHTWLAGTNYGGLTFNLIEDGTWHHYEAIIANPWPGQPVHLMLEDFRTPAENAYFDNLVLRDSSLAVPDSSTTSALLGLGLLGLVAIRRRVSRS